MAQQKSKTANQFPILWLVTLAIVSCVLNLFSGCQRAQTEPTDAKTTLSPGAAVELPFVGKKVRLEIENPLGLAATLFFVQGDQLTKIQSLGPNQNANSFLVPSGFYMIRAIGSSPADSSKSPPPTIEIPVPAVADSIGATTLKIQIPAPVDAQADWCWIPTGPSIHGDTLGVGAANERPVRIEYIEGFWLGQTEVTNLQYAKFLSNQATIDARWIDLESMKCRIRETSDGRFDSDAPNLPVVMVSYFGAKAYCDWLTQTTGQVHRLPSETEWEKAARGPRSSVYAYGNVYQTSMANQESGVLKEVASYPANGFGLYDMTGNAFEWIADRNDPSGDRIYDQSLRGGSFVLDGMYLRNSFRMRQSRSVRTDDIGFRVAKNANKIE